MLLCIFPLLTGGASYIFLRRNGLFGVSINLIYSKPSQLWMTVINVLPDFCWAFSLSNALHFLFSHNTFPFAKSTFIIALVIVFSEVIQVFFSGYFTFDIFDLFAALIAVCLSSKYCQRNLYENKSL